jgi:hypothetical protein
MHFKQLRRWLVADGDERPVDFLPAAGRDSTAGATRVSKPRGRRQVIGARESAPRVRCRQQLAADQGMHALDA